MNLKDSYAIISNGEIFVKGMHISPYEKGNIYNKDPVRQRRLLLHKKEINKLFGLSTQQGFSIVPLSVYFKGCKVKIEIALAKGKKLYDKREDSAKRVAKIAIDRSLKERQRA